jgi:two-component system, OmpR family, alkaline phosphatase synthesis response regulator PhoP
MDDSRAQCAPRGEALSPLRNIRVLVVDNDSATANAVLGILSEEECDVRAVRTAEEALAILAAFAAQVIVLNLLLPRMSGLLLVKRLKANPDTRDIVVVSTSRGDWGDAETLSREAGCASHLSHPIAAPRLSAMLRLLPRGRP